MAQRREQQTPDRHASWWERLKLSPFRHSLSMPLLVSVGVMLGLSLIIVSEHRSGWRDVQRVVELSDFLAEISDTVHQQQIERGLSALYLSGGSQTAQERLSQQRIITDRTLSELRNTIPSVMATDNAQIAEALNAVLKTLKQFSAIRTSIDSHSITADASFRYYSAVISQLFSLCQAVAHSTDNATLRERATGLRKLNYIKELNGQIRALGSEGFASGRLSSNTHLKLVQLVGLQNELLKEIPPLITTKAHDHLDQIRRSPDLTSMLLLRQMLLNNGAQNLPKSEAITWFDTTTAFINKLKEVENLLIEDLQQTSLKLQKKMRTQFYVLVAILAAVLGLSISSLWKGHLQSRRIQENLEASLHIEQARSSQILEAMTDAVCVVDGNGRVEYANPAMLRAFGDGALTEFAEKILPCVGTEGCALTSDGLLFRESNCCRATSPISGKGYSVFCTSFYTEKKSLSRLVVMNDVTAHIMAEQRLLEAKEAAECANKTKSEILANMSHELRTPLNAIIGFSDMMLNRIYGALGHSQYDSYARDIHESGKHLLTLINDILDVSAIEAGKVVLQKELFDIGKTIDSAIRLIMPRAQKGQVNIAVEHAGHSSEIYADQRRIKQVVLNLLSNAVKFTKPNGRVVVRTSSTHAGEIIVSVSDTGVGMTPAELEVAFQPFGQADSGLNRKHEGSGLGLPLTKSLTELHGGRLEVQSKSGQGTSVTLTFPPCPSDHGGANDPSPTSNASHSASSKNVVPTIKTNRTANTNRAPSYSNNPLIITLSSAQPQEE